MGQRNFLPCPKALHSLAQGSDDAYRLVPGDHTGSGLLLAFVDADVGVADAGGSHLQEHLAGARSRLRALFDPHVAGAVEDAGFHRRLGALSEAPGAGKEVHDREDS
jgi:hypothetical protein